MHQLLFVFATPVLPHKSPSPPTRSPAYARMPLLVQSPRHGIVEPAPSHLLERAAAIVQESVFFRYGKTSDIQAVARVYEAHAYRIEVLIASREVDVVNRAVTSLIRVHAPLAGCCNERSDFGGRITRRAEVYFGYVVSAQNSIPAYGRMRTALARRASAPRPSPVPPETLADAGLDALVASIGIGQKGLSDGPLRAEVHIVAEDYLRVVNRAPDVTLAFRRNAGTWKIETARADDPQTGAGGPAQERDVELTLARFADMIVAGLTEPPEFSPTTDDGPLGSEGSPQ